MAFETGIDQNGCHRRIAALAQLHRCVVDAELVDERIEIAKAEFLHDKVAQFVFGQRHAFGESRHRQFRILKETLQFDNMHKFAGLV